MKKYFPFILLFFLIIGQSSRAQDMCLKRMTWLNGNWKSMVNGTLVTDEWTEAGSGSIKCRSFEVKGNDSTLVERATIRCVAGKLVFTFFPVQSEHGESLMPVSYALISEDNGVFIFENKQQKFPQRVIYRHSKENEYQTSLEGMAGDKEMKTEIIYERVK